MLELDHVGFSYGKRLILDNASALFEEGLDSTPFREDQ